jgi:hypothetical protein
MKEPSPREAAKTADAVEAHAYADFFAAAPTALREKLGLRIEQVAGATLLIAPGVPTPMFNRAIGFGLERAAESRDIDAMLALYGETRTKWWLHWSPYAGPTGFESQLLHCGFTLASRRSWAKMLRGPESPPQIATDLDIGPAVDREADSVARAIAQAFEMPPSMADWLRGLYGRPRWRVYAVRDGAQVVGGGCLFVSGTEAWLGMGSVLASHRRRGGQGALMALRIADAAAAGATAIVTETGEQHACEPNPSLANMRRCGFITVASRSNFASP